MSQHQMIPIDQIELDKTNPRIQHALEMYGGKITAEHIKLALGATTNDPDEETSQKTPNIINLRKSILANGGIIQPIILNRKGENSYICIEGNTRVLIYREFLSQKKEGNWSSIPAIIHDHIEQSDIDAIRLSAHLVGPRPWYPYSKAKYLNHLRTSGSLSWEKIRDLCGGSELELKYDVAAYEDIEEYYRPVVEDRGYDFDVRRFSGFVELQKPGIKQAIFDAGYDLTNFANWIHDGKLKPLNTIRRLPNILKNEGAKKAFLKDGAWEAIKKLDIGTDQSKTLKEASIEDLSRELISRIYKLNYDKDQKLRESESMLASIDDLFDAVIHHRSQLNTVNDE